MLTLLFNSITCLLVALGKICRFLPPLFIDTFQFDSEFQKNEQQYKKIRNELLADEDRKGSKSSDSGSDDASDSSKGRSPG